MKSMLLICLGILFAYGSVWVLEFDPTEDIFIAVGLAFFAIVLLLGGVVGLRESE